MTITRAERRLRSERRILDAARALFADRGFERTTIRAVAAAAGVDPALVMQYFGSKQELFSRAVQAVPTKEGEPGEARDLAGRMLETLGMKLGGLSPASLAMLRSMLTHPEAADAARTALGGQIDRVGAELPGDDARLRAALATSVLLGVTVGHQLLGLDPLRDAPREEIDRLLRPALLALLGERE
ncbi:TetR/AcrR family transcriptional regulator [Streptosporangium pseudovulgare]|uniref:TetR family transcriptional regulator n=1 Tax=Streptosporangium pseudovulgare TaxID=35765 RepID=A0ABQ2QND3_9ACTN|nr:TetR/AcrR family transcriptional regulator [Streptosporangium pseudovulgare]GGP89557.1 TetR family transcriptional regulator [Streptosporangium pseudovulgare]